MYGLTWRGFIASIAINGVRRNLVQVLKNSPLLIFPEKELVLPFLEENLTVQEAEILARAILESYLKTIPDLEYVQNEPMSLLSSFFNMREKPELPQGFKLSKMPRNTEQLLQLLDKPTILEAVKGRLIPLIRQKTSEFETMYSVICIFNELGTYISRLEIKDQPSKKISEYIEHNLSPKLSELEMREP